MYRRIADPAHFVALKKLQLKKIVIKTKLFFDMQLYAWVKENFQFFNYIDVHMFYTIHIIIYNPCIYSLYTYFWRIRLCYALFYDLFSNFHRL